MPLLTIVQWKNIHDSEGSKNIEISLHSTLQGRVIFVRFLDSDHFFWSSSFRVNIFQEVHVCVCKELRYHSPYTDVVASSLSVNESVFIMTVWHSPFEIKRKTSFVSVMCRFISEIWCVCERWWRSKKSLEELSVRLITLKQDVLQRELISSIWKVFSYHQTVIRILRDIDTSERVWWRRRRVMCWLRGVRCDELDQCCDE